MDAKLREQCRSLLDQLHQSQDKLKAGLVSQTCVGNNFDDESFVLKPTYARTKLSSVARPDQTLTKSVNFGYQEGKENVRPTDCDSMYSGMGSRLTGATSVDSNFSQSNSQDVTSKRDFPSVQVDNLLGSSSSEMVTPGTPWKRQLIDRHTNVPTKLNAQELKELNNVRKLNFSYSHVSSDEMNNVRAKKDMMNGQGYEEPMPQPVSKGILHSDHVKNVGQVKCNSSKIQVKPHTESSTKQDPKSFKKQLEDDGNNRKLNNFIKDASIKAKTSLNSTSYSLNSSNRKNSSKVHWDTSNVPADFTGDKRLLGYDWIAALLDNDSGLMDQSESFFNELKDFRRLHKAECSNQTYMAGPHTLVDFEPEPVVEALRDPKVQPYIVNERLFTEPFKSNLIDSQNLDEKSGQTSKEPTSDNPRFVRVSFPRSTLQSPHRVKPHRRRSFDASDTCSLVDHCLLGWETTWPTMIPTAKSLDLNTEAGTRVDSQISTLAEAERLALEHNHHHWFLDRPPTHPRPLPSWRKHYMDTTLNMSIPMTTSGSQSTGGTGSESIKRSTDKLLSSTYATMYEMERLREARKLESLCQGKETH